MFINESLTAKGYTPAAQVPQVYGGPRVIDGIVIHHWGDPGQSHGGVVNYFVNGPGSTSAHFVSSGAGGTHCLVSPKDAAWHAGNAEANRTKIGIELRPEASEDDYREAAALIAWLRKEYNHPLPLSPHRQWQPTACPGIWDLSKLDGLARGLAGATSITPQSTTTKPTASEEDDMSKAAELDISRVRQILESWEISGLLARVIAMDQRTATMAETIKYVKGADEVTLYEINEATGELRGISLEEWQASGRDYRILPQALINRLKGK
jgi:N-acetylmuramoyl-L-alanine amidase CwlA